MYLFHVLVLLSRFLGAAASIAVLDLVNDLLEGTEVNGGFNWAHTDGTRTENIEVPEVDAYKRQIDLVHSFA